MSVHKSVDEKDESMNKQGLLSRRHCSKDLRVSIRELSKQKLEC